MKQRNLKVGDHVRTRGGRPAGIYRTDAPGEFPVHGWREDATGNAVACSRLADGRAFMCKDLSDDLILVPEKREAWVVLFGDSGAMRVRSARDAQLRAVTLSRTWPHVSIHRIEYEVES